MKVESRILDHLTFLYGKEKAGCLWTQLQVRLGAFRKRNPHLLKDVPPPGERLTERDAFLITYGDQISEPGRRPLQTLANFLESYLHGAISGVHLLSFYPYSSDDGFSVIDYRQVDPRLGTWNDVTRIGQGFRLMFDAVINHTSHQSPWFQAFLRGEAPYTDYFIVVEPSTDLSMVVRPRTSPLLTPVETAYGKRYVWTTFSADQIDLNYANPQVLLEVIDLLLLYAERGGNFIRLDAIAYLWKEIGTPCIHLPQTHRVVKLFRAVLDAVAPGVILVTETNVLHEENISYFGDGGDEAQMVYQFPLAPLVLHAFHTGDARRLTNWAATLQAPSATTTFFNLIASHDGLGIMPARGLLSEDEIQALVERTLAHGGQISHKPNPDGTASIYELNITLFDALNDPNAPQPDVDVRRFLASQAIMLSLGGVPGIYFHSLLGSRNCYECVARTGRARSINREKFTLAALEADLADAAATSHQVFQGYLHLLRQRQAHPAFHPNGGQRVLPLHEALFAVVRTSPDRTETVLCLVNISPQFQVIQMDPLAWDLPHATLWQDLIGGYVYPLQEACLSLSLEAYQTLWLQPVGQCNPPVSSASGVCYFAP